MEDGEFVACFSEDGTRVFTGWTSGYVKIFDPTTMNLVKQIKVPNSSFVDIESSPDSLLVAATSGDGSILVFEQLTGKLVSAIAGPGRTVVDVNFDSTTGQIVAVASNGEMYVFDPYSGKTLAGPHPTGGRTGAMTISEDSSLVATGGVDGIVTVFKYAAPAGSTSKPKLNIEPGQSML